MAELSNDQLRSWYQSQIDTSAGLQAAPDTDLLRRAYAESWRATNAGESAAAVLHRVSHVMGLAHPGGWATPAASIGSPPAPYRSDEELLAWYTEITAPEEDEFPVEVSSELVATLSEDGGQSTDADPLPRQAPAQPPTISELRAAWEWYWIEDLATPPGDVENKSLKHRLLHKLGWGHGD